MPDPRIIAHKGTYLIPAHLVAEGDALDLEGDRYADPKTFADPTYQPTPDETADGFRYESAAVIEVTREGSTTIVIETTLGTFGFPVGHLIEVALENMPDPG